MKTREVRRSSFRGGFFLSPVLAEMKRGKGEADRYSRASLAVHPPGKEAKRKEKVERPACTEKKAS